MTKQEILTKALAQLKECEDARLYAKHGLSLKPVAKFMEAAGQKDGDFSTALLYRQLIEEEVVKELFVFFDAFVTIRNGGKAYHPKDGHELTQQECIIQTLDGGADGVFTIVALMLSMQFEFEGAWNEVCRSNLSKVQEDGKIHKHPRTGKVMKPDTYSPPNLEHYV